MRLIFSIKIFTCKNPPVSSTFFSKRLKGTAVPSICPSAITSSSKVKILSSSPHIKNLKKNIYQNLFRWSGWRPGYTCDIAFVRLGRKRTFHFRFLLFRWIKIILTVRHRVRNTTLLFLEVCVTDVLFGFVSLIFTRTVRASFLQSNFHDDLWPFLSYLNLLTCARSYSYRIAILVGDIACISCR